MQESMVAVEHLGFGYGGVYILEDISFHVESGEFAAIIGSNGAGKSTLLRLLLGELHPKTGNIHLFGQPISHFRQWSRIGYVPQNALARSAHFPATVEEMVQANLYRQIGPVFFGGKAARQKVQAALEAVDAAHLSKRMLEELSGGEFQRALIARAIVADPQMLLLDEPTAGMDVTSSQGLYKLLEDLNSQGMTILMVTHDMDRSIHSVHKALCIEHSTMVTLSKDMLMQELSGRHLHPGMDCSWDSV